MLKDVASMQIQKVAIYDSDRKKNNLISNKSFRYSKLKDIDYFWTHSYILNIS